MTKNPNFIRVGARVGFLIQPNGCWDWKGSRNEDGYGRWKIPGLKGSSAHRHIYEWLRGPITPGETLDHLCRNPRCVNPEHLERCSMRENILRGQGMAAQHARQTHCIHGHELTEENTYHRPDRPKGRGRQCRHCYRDFIDRKKKSADQHPRPTGVKWPKSRPNDPAATT